MGALDPTALAFYAIICGLLSALAPSLGRPLRRLTIGAVVGILAAALLPTLKVVLGI